MIRNKKFLSMILAAAIVSNLFVVSASASTNEDNLYKVAYEATMKALEKKGQTEINEARKAVNQLPQSLQGFKGEFSKQVDTVQHPILVEIVNNIEKAKMSVDQKDVNEARKSVPKDLPDMWRNSYSVAIDGVQNQIIVKVANAIEKAQGSKNKDRAKVAKDLIAVLQGVEDNEMVKGWIDAKAKEFEAFVTQLDKSNGWSTLPDETNTNDSTQTSSDFLAEFNKYINGTSVEATDIKKIKDKEVLNLLLKYKNQLPLPDEFLNGTDGERLLYADRVRCFIKGFQVNIESKEKFKEILGWTYNSFKVGLETSKFQAHFSNENYKPVVIKVNKNDKNIDITDQVMKLTKELSKGTFVIITEVRGGNNFEIENRNGSQRIILKSVDDSILNKPIDVMIALQLEGAGSSMTNLSLTVTN